MRRKVAKKGRCPVDGKVTYRDERSARTAIGNIKARNGHESKMPQRVYWCEDARGWHLTSADYVSGLYAEKAKMENDE